MNKKIIVGIIAIAIVILGFVFANLNGMFTLSKDNEYTIGAILPLSGEASTFGQPFQETMILAVNEINEKGGINGKKLNIVFEDGACDTTPSVNAINKLININNTKVVIGGICSSETIAAAPIAENNKVILFSPASGSPNIIYSGDYIFRNMASDAYSGKKIAETAIQNKHLKIAIITENTEYATSLSKVFRENYNRLGGEVIIEEKFETNINDFKTIITKINSKEIDAIYINPQTPQTFTILLKQLKESGVNKQLYGNEYTRSKEVLDNFSKEIEGIIFAEANFNENDSLTKSFLEKLEQNNIDLSFPSYQTKVYDSVYIIKEALEECGEDTECIKENLYSIENRKGTDGILTIDDNGDAELDFIVKTIKNGEIVVYNN